MEGSYQTGQCPRVTRAQSYFASSGKLCGGLPQDLLIKGEEAGLVDPLTPSSLIGDYSCGC